VGVDINGSDQLPGLQHRARGGTDGAPRP
jgi:hypothetical protein